MARAVGYTECAAQQDSDEYSKKFEGVLLSCRGGREGDMDECVSHQCRCAVGVFAQVDAHSECDEGRVIAELEGGGPVSEGLDGFVECIRVEVAEE
jgi:hypothetical protein